MNEKTCMVGRTREELEQALKTTGEMARKVANDLKEERKLTKKLTGEINTLQRKLAYVNKMNEKNYNNYCEALKEVQRLTKIIEGE